MSTMAYPEIFLSVTYHITKKPWIRTAKEELKKYLYILTNNPHLVINFDYGNSVSF